VTTYVIGDIHGCWRTLQRLLERIGWDPLHDELWLVGDLVNRGPQSLEVLRWAAGQKRLVATLGNHDLHLLARAEELLCPRPEDNLREVLAAPDRDELLAWMRRQPFVHRRGDLMMVHAGLMPSWDEDDALALAHQARDRLNDDGDREFLEQLCRKPRPRWRASIGGDERIAAAVSVFTRARVVGPDGEPELGFTGPPEAAPDGCKPWFEGSDIVERGMRVVFGHWAQLGLHRSGGALCLDSGCVYGGSLTAWCPDDGRMISEPTSDAISPRGG
jgi:bis(5'-nucleosyl)-tetraphosphatase (symmetrical)